MPYVNTITLNTYFFFIKVTNKIINKQQKNLRKSIYKSSLRFRNRTLNEH